MRTVKRFPRTTVRDSMTDTQTIYDIDELRSRLLEARRFL